MGKINFHHCEFAVNPLCKVIVGFKNFTRHATRSKYISFAIQEQPEMCKLLLLIAKKQLSSEKITSFSSQLFEQLIDYGFLKLACNLSFKEKVMSCFNFLNENRWSRLQFQGKCYVVTSFVFMAFYSQKEDEFIRETAILPYWCQRISDITFEIMTQKFDSKKFLALPMSLKKKLLKHGVVVPVEKLPYVENFFKEHCVLSHALIEELPDFYKTHLPSVQNDKTHYQLNPQLYFDVTTIPSFMKETVTQFEWICACQPSIWVFNPVKKVLSAYWLTDQQRLCLQDLKNEKIHISALHDDMFQLFVYSFILQNEKITELARKNWQASIENLREQLAKNDYLMFDALLAPIELAMSRKYLRYRMEKKLLIPDQANGSTKNRYWVHRDEFTFYLQGQVCVLLNQILPTPVKSGHNALTVYTPGATLPKHQDDVLAFSWVLSLAIETNPEQRKENAWPIFVETPDTKVHPAMLQAGDGVLINPQMPHWRDELTGHSLNILFMWFIPHTFRGYVNGSWVE